MFEPGFAVAVTSAPAAEPISTTDAKTHLRVSGSSEDAYIDTLVKAARRHVEEYLGRALVTQTRKLFLDRFPAWIIEVPFGPLQSVSSITYVDNDGVSQTIDSGNYRVDIYSSPPRITPAYGEVWPTPRQVSHAVTVTYVCGYGTASAVPADIIHAMKLQMTHLYENRGEDPDVGQSLVPAARALLSLYKIASFQ